MVIVGGGLAGLAAAQTDRGTRAERRGGRSRSSSSRPRTGSAARSGPTASAASCSKAGPTRSSPTSPGASTSAGPSAWATSSIGPDAEQSPVVRRPRRATDAGARGVRPDGPATARADPDDADPLGPRQAPGADGPRPAAAGRRRRREPGRVRQASARPRGVRPARPAARRRDLHGRPQRAEPPGDPAAVPRRWSASTAA